MVYMSSVSGILFIRCPKCQAPVCSGIVSTVAEAMGRFGENSSFCLVCRRWFKWAEASAEVRAESQ
jgi:hypothetical protein